MADGGSARRLSSGARVIFPAEWNEQAAEGDAVWWNQLNYVTLNATDAEALFLSQALRRSIPAAKLLGIERVQHRALWRSYADFRDTELPIRSIDGEVNEQLLFHGTGPTPAKEALKHPEGLDPRFSKGGFYGQGVYLAEDPSYPVGGRYAHRVAGSNGLRMQLVVVRAALGTCQEVGQRIDAATKGMRMPGTRDEGPPRVLYDSVRAGPHRPSTAGTGTNASIIYVAYEARQLYPAYIIEFELAVEALIADALIMESATSSTTANAPPAKKLRASASTSNPASSAAASASSSSASASSSASTSAAACTSSNSKPVPVLQVPHLITVVKKFASANTHDALDRLLERYRAKTVGKAQMQLELRRIVGRGALCKAMTEIFPTIAADLAKRRSAS